MTHDLVHLYTLCWNEEKLLPHFFRHYDPIVDKYFIFDTGSTDNSFEILSANPKVTASKLELKGDSYVEAARTFYSEQWKDSRGKTEWIFVCSIDEHLYHPRLRDFLTACTRHSISIINTVGYEMISDEFPSDNLPLHEQITHGFRATGFDKPQIFSPGRIREINFTVGRHRAIPETDVGLILPGEKSDTVKLLHYKFLGLDYLITRFRELRSGLRKGDLEKKYGAQYLLGPEELAWYFNQQKLKAIDVYQHD